MTIRLTLVNATQATDSFALALNAPAWPAALSASTAGPLAPGQTATFSVSVTIPASTPAGERAQQTLLISNTGPAPLDIALFEVDVFLVLPHRSVRVAGLRHPVD